MINISEIKKKKGYVVEFKKQPDVDAEFVKSLRKKLNLSQSMFAELLNVKKKTVEKWEQGTNPISNGNAVAMIIFDKHPEMAREFIEINEPIKNYVEFEFDFTQESCLKHERLKDNQYSNYRDMTQLFWNMQRN